MKIMDLILFIAAILIFTLVDVLGFYKILNYDPSHPRWRDKSYSEYDAWSKRKETKNNLLLYRIIQTIIQIGIAFTIGYFVPYYYIGWMFLIIHFFGIHDYLYYIYVGKYQSMKSYKEEMFWLWWTVFGALNKKWRNPKTLEIVSLTSLVIFSGTIVLQMIYKFI